MPAFLQRWVIGAAACFLFNACSSPPSEPGSTGVAQAEQRAAASPGELRNSLAGRLSRSTEGLTARRTSAGSMRLDSKGRFRHMSVSARGPDGRVQQRCISSPAELDALLAEDQKARQP
jgi:hypothetical protein